MPRVLWLCLALLLLPGCSGMPGGTAPPVVEVAGHYVSFQPPPGWKADGAQWFKSGEGRLTVVQAGPDSRRLAADQVALAIDGLGSGPAAAEQALKKFPPVWFEYEPDRERLDALSTQVRKAGSMIRKDPARARRELEAARRGFQKTELGDDPQARARAYVENLNRRGGRRTLESVSPATCAGRPAAVAVTATEDRAACTALFMVDRGELVVFEIRTSGADRARGAEWIQALAGGIRLDAPAPALASETGTPQATAHRGARPVQKAPSAWDRALRAAVPPLIFLLFTAVPAWLGAGIGYDSAPLVGRDPRDGAARGAFWATGAGIMLACVIVAFVMLTLLAGPHAGSGIMTPGVAWVVLTTLLLVGGAAAGAVGGGLAALGAWLGAGTSRRNACILAALLGAAGTLLGPMLLKALG